MITTQVVQSAGAATSSSGFYVTLFSVGNCTGRTLLPTLYSGYLQVLVQLIRHFKTCTTDIYLQNECAHVGLSLHAPVVLCSNDNLIRRHRYQCTAVVPVANYLRANLDTTFYMVGKFLTWRHLWFCAYCMFHLEKYGANNMVQTRARWHEYYRITCSIDTYGCVSN